MLDPSCMRWFGALLLLPGGHPRITRVDAWCWSVFDSQFDPSVTSHPPISCRCGVELVVLLTREVSFARLDELSCHVQAKV